MRHRLSVVTTEGRWLMESLRRVCFVLLTVLAAVSAANAAGWPQFRGPSRDGTSPETGLLTQWPQEGPRELWSVEGLGTGYASVSVADGLVLTTGLVGDQGYLFAFDLQGKPKYRVNYGAEWTDSGNYPSARTTPTIDGDRLYLMSGLGRIACHKLATGEPIWHVDTLQKFQGKNIRWGIAESLLIDGEKVLCTPGGPDATVVALNKMTGETLWTSKGLSEPSAYCSPILVERGPNRLIVTLVQKSLVGIDAGTGKVYWTVPHEVNYDIQAVSPIHKDGLIYITNGYRHGSHGFLLSADGTSIEKKWSEKSLDVHHGGAVLVGGNIHGAATNGTWICLDLATGSVKHTDKLIGKGSVVYVDGMLYGYSERGLVGLIRIKPDGYELVSSFRVQKGSKEHWAHPAISDGRLYIRHGEVLMCYDVKGR
ncbi:MAG TPA: PQQ-binding-like beta-propeller repeat protein [Sedimentisphaerales bacterium]|nr:PQQ-binding-like beta-propeller repeat protein [Sedimentisphaerales bacterium]